MGWVHVVFGLHALMVLPLATLGPPFVAGVFRDQADEPAATVPRGCPEAAPLPPPTPPSSPTSHTHLSTFCQVTTAALLRPATSPRGRPLWGTTRTFSGSLSGRGPSSLGSTRPWTACARAASAASSSLWSWGTPTGILTKWGPPPPRSRRVNGGLCGFTCFWGGRAFRGRLPPAPRLAVATLHHQGKRALSFVLKNQGMIDKTLLFDVELLKVGTRGPLTSAAAAAGGEEGGA